MFIETRFLVFLAAIVHTKRNAIKTNTNFYSYIKAIRI